MDQPGPSSPLRRVRTAGDTNLPASRHFPRERHSHDIPSPAIPDILRLPARSRTVDRFPAVHHPDPSSLIITPRRPTTPRPVLDANLVAPITPPVLETTETLSEPHRSPRARLRAFFGLGNDPELRERKDLVSLVWNFFFNGVQIALIIALLVFSSVHKSTSDHQLSEWTACSRPLGTWNAIWAVKLCFDCVLAFWTFRRDRVHRSSPLTPNDIEAAFNPLGLNENQSSPAFSNPNPSVRPRNQNSPRSSGTLPYSNLYARLSIFLSFFSFVWFVAINVLIYSSVFTCRITSPHLWWLTFGIAAVTYLMILELFLLGLIVFIVGPIVYLVWNIFLICIGHHPLQNPHYIKPEIGKLPKSVVDRIPLVLYIPSPPVDDPHKGPIAKPDPVHTYPPKPPTPAPPRRRFAFLRIKPSRKDKSKNEKDKDDSNSNEKKASGSGASWEDNWEHGEYPFVRLEGNRAACAICLMDFEEPKRVNGETEESNKDVKEIESSKKVPRADRSQVVTEEDRLKLEDAGDGPQPLRLLACGHVFHQTCLDPWLTGVSGRCPVCQRSVEFQEPQKNPPRDQGR